ncbi:HNH endonuclease [Streptomyces rochei]|uniref:HNH endonuclease n=1 Tax=Streptomyces rochei TaxID=1928 RepID=UPI00367E1A86
MKRDGYACTVNGCANPATEVDHIRPGDDHSMGNLRAICSDCHKRKSSTEGGQARQRQAAQQRTEIRRRTARFDRREKHPGEL